MIAGNLIYNEFIREIKGWMIRCVNVPVQSVPVQWASLWALPHEQIYDPGIYEHVAFSWHSFSESLEHSFTSEMFYTRLLYC